MLRRIRDTIRLSEQCEREYLSVYEILFNRIRENTGSDKETKCLDN